MGVYKNPIYGVLPSIKNFWEITNRYNNQLQMGTQDFNLNGE